MAMKRYIKAESAEYEVLTSSNPYDRRDMARETTNPEIVEILQYDPDDDVRRDLASNPNLPVEKLMEFAQSDDPALRWGVAQNDSAPAKILSMLSDDEDFYVRRDVGCNDNTPPDILAKLASDPESAVRYWVATNNNTPVEALQRLACDPEDNTTCREANLTLFRIKNDKSR